jgi:hypothetical protein
VVLVAIGGRGQKGLRMIRETGGAAETEVHEAHGPGGEEFQKLLRALGRKGLDMSLDGDGQVAADGFGVSPVSASFPESIMMGVV